MKIWIPRFLLILVGVVAGVIGALIFADHTKTEWTKVAEAINHLAQAFALIVAGMWTYWIFVAQRSNEPKAAIEHAVTFVLLNPQTVLIRATISVRNSGRVLLTPSLLKVAVSQVLPVADALKSASFPNDAPDNNWPEIQSKVIDCTNDQVTLEPDEIQRFPVDFCATPPLDTVQLSSALYLLPADTKIERGPGKDGQQTIDTDQFDSIEEKLIWDEVTLHDIPARK